MREKGQMPKAYLRFDPNLDRHPDDDIVVMVRLWCAGNRQDPRGIFKTWGHVVTALGKRARHAKPHLTENPDGSWAIDHWEIWQEGDINVGERMRRYRDRRRKGTVSSAVTPAVTPAVTESVTEPSQNRNSPSEASGVRRLNGETNPIPVGGQIPEGPDEPARPPAESDRHGAPGELERAQAALMANLGETARHCHVTPDWLLTRCSRVNGRVMVSPLSCPSLPWVKTTDAKITEFRMNWDADRPENGMPIHEEEPERAELKRFLDTHGAPAALAEKALAWAADHPPAEGTETEAQLAVRWLTAIDGPRIAGAMISTAISFARKRRRTA
jgi:hypothetical protein